MYINSCCPSFESFKVIIFSPGFNSSSIPVIVTNSLYSYASWFTSSFFISDVTLHKYSYVFILNCLSNSKSIFSPFSFIPINLTSAIPHSGVASSFSSVGVISVFFASVFFVSVFLVVVFFVVVFVGCGFDVDVVA